MVNIHPRDRVKAWGAAGLTLLALTVGGIFGGTAWEQVVVKSHHEGWKDRTAVVVYTGQTDGGRRSDLLEYQDWHGKFIVRGSKLPQAMQKGNTEHVVISRNGGRPWIEDENHESCDLLVFCNTTSYNPLKPSLAGPLWGGIIGGIVTGLGGGWLVFLGTGSLLEAGRRRRLGRSGNLYAAQLLDLRRTIQDDPPGEERDTRLKRIDELLEKAQEHGRNEDNVDLVLDVIEEHLSSDIRTRREARQELRASH